MYEKFQKLLEEKNLTVYKVSIITGIAQSTFSDWKKRYEEGKEEGKSSNLSVENLKILSEKLDVPITYFLEG